MSPVASQATSSVDDLQGQLRQQAHDLEEARAQQTASAEVLQVINSSRGDLTLVFDTILEKAHRLCGAAKGALVTYDGEVFRAVATRGLSHEYAAMLRAPQDNPPGSPPHLLLQGERLVQIPDMGELDFPIPRAAARLEGVRTVLFVPLRKEDALLGYITVYRQEVRPFTDRDIALLENFAAQAVIAIENARLLNELRQRTDDLTESLEQQTATSEILASLSGLMIDTKPVFDAIVRSLLRLFGTGFATVQLVQDGMMHLAAFDGEAGFEKLAAHFPIPLDDNTVNGRAMLSKQAVQFAPLVGNPAAPQGTARLAGSFGYNSIIAAPMLRGNQVIGAISTARRDPKPFGDKQVDLIKSFANQAVIAIENARLLNELRQRTDDLSESLEQQTATSEVLRIISSSAGELEPVFQEILEKATRICGAKFGIMYRHDNEVFQPAATCSVPSEVANFLAERGAFRPRAGSPFGELARTKLPINISDVVSQQVFKPPGRPILEVRAHTWPYPCSGKVSSLVQLLSIRKRSCHSPRSKSIWSRISPPKPSSQSRTRGCSTSCANRSSNRQRPPMSSRLSVAPRLICSRCSILWSNQLLGYAMPTTPQSTANLATPIGKLLIVANHPNCRRS